METAHKVKELEQSAVELTISVAKETVEQEYAKIVSKYAKTLQIKGFRKGKAPVSVLENKFGDALREETMYTIIEEGVKSALDEVEDAYKPLHSSTPHLVDEEQLKLDPQAPFDFLVTYDVFPTFELPEYTGYELSVPEADIDDAAVNEELERLRDQNALVIEKEVPAAEGSIVTVNYAELDEEDNPIEGTEREGYVFTVGTGYNIYKFDDDIIGMSAGESKIIEKSFDEDYSISEYAGKSVRVKVTIQVVKVRELPELDDDFAQDISEEYETLDDLKKATRKKLEDAASMKLRTDKLEKLYDALLEHFTLAVPESMITSEMESSFARYASQSGLDAEQFEQIMAMQGRTKEQLFEEWRPVSIRSIKIQLLLSRIADEEKITVDDEELKEHEEEFSHLEDQRQKEYYQLLWKEDRKIEKTLDLLLEKNSFSHDAKLPYSQFMHKHHG
jgi:trigger factor